jgi:hypothetical protein
MPATHHWKQLVAAWGQKVSPLDYTSGTDGCHEACLSHFQRLLIAAPSCTIVAGEPLACADMACTVLPAKSH